jgi:hypothetical protein|tara:strand:+ start:9706 stop:10086 length:381 start_codon:yes stop_codon:yes gene_type:complete
MVKVRKSLLDQADKLICGGREADYGDPRKNFSDIAAGWSLIIDKKIKPEEVALMMAWLKIARLFKTPDHVDSWVDLVGYAALGGELAQKMGNTDTTDVLASYAGGDNNGNYVGPSRKATLDSLEIV